ncbi:hypothetical protein F5B20DRAFT_87350 [Whalleya microplaca]|nr:hypothetical protein F5B20DRAFT_87350 [Whalleya microplaca]
MRKIRSPLGENIFPSERHRYLHNQTPRPFACSPRRRPPSSSTMCQPLPMSENEGRLGNQEPLSVWNQSAPRVYICVVLCFPCDSQLQGDAARHIELSLKRLARERPVFAGRLRASSNGGVSLHRSPLLEIPFQVLTTDEASEQDYERMRDEGFPPSIFVHPRFGVSGSISPGLDSVPVSKVQAVFPKGGLMLSIFLHHGLVDGGSLRVFLECFAAQTRRTLVDLPSEQAFPMLDSRNCRNPAHIHSVSAFRGLMARCPEFTMLPDLSGPTQPRLLKTGMAMRHIEKTGKIFVFSHERLQELRELIRSRNHTSEPPTAYTSLAALAFAHITKSRVAAEKYLPGVRPRPVATLWNSVNWRTRAFQDAAAKYFGNAALPAVTEASITQLAAACDDDEKLAQLVPLVKQSIDAVNEEYVSRRLAMLSEAPDPRLVGVNYDPRMPEVLAFNTWRHFGADIEWSIPGVPVARADAIRRAHGCWNLGTALILPAKADSMKQELFVSLSIDAMKLLCADGGWMKWVDRVIG